MDRPVSTPVALAPGVDNVSSSGWDAHTVWQERVRNPHLGAGRAAGSPRIRLEDHSAGWDPLETWRLRVQRPRKKPA
ncbi:MAG TPA: hypothetical protein VMU00_03585 [Steroidobacteraceae bacterium]|nr:hypothetical protein [Steroidobacteraceae bacterium]